MNCNYAQWKYAWSREEWSGNAHTEREEKKVLSINSIQQMYAWSDYQVIQKESV